MLYGTRDVDYVRYTLQTGCELVELGKTAAAFLLDADLYVTDPATLQLNSLSDDLLFQAVRQTLNVSCDLKS